MSSSTLWKTTSQRQRITTDTEQVIRQKNWEDVHHGLPPVSIKLNVKNYVENNKQVSQKQGQEALASTCPSSHKWLIEKKLMYIGTHTTNLPTDIETIESYKR